MDNSRVDRRIAAGVCHARSLVPGNPGNPASTDLVGKAVQYSDTQRTYRTGGVGRTFRLPTQILGGRRA